LKPEQIEVAIGRADELEVPRGLSSECDEMWSYVGRKANPRWLWHAIDHHTGQVLAYVFGRRQDKVFLRLQALLEPFGITRYYTDGWGTWRCTLNSRPKISWFKVEPCNPLPWPAADRRPLAFGS
jgi:insertion element IS1 protein InsB